MFFCLLYLVSALSISAVAAYFSVVGLATIFPGSMIPIIIMGGVLEIGKIVTAIWLHRNWKTSPFLVRTYLSFATLVLMGITSMGIFGFLSRAHIEHATTTEKAVAMTQTIDNKIKRENDYIERQNQYIASLENRSSNTASSARLDIDQETSKIKDITEQLNKDTAFEMNRTTSERARLQELNNALSDLESLGGGLFSSKKKKIEELKAAQAPARESINKRISEYDENIRQFRSDAQSKIKSIEGKITAFRNQTQEKDTSVQPQIEEHSKNIADAYGRIDDLQNEKLGFEDNARQLEAEVGPVKYVAEAIADFTGKEFDISQAVRIVIIILVLVFDPLAILLVIAANISIMKNFHLEDKNLNKIEEAKKKAQLKLDEIIKGTTQATEEYSKTNEELSSLQTKKSELDAKINKLNSKVNQLNSAEQDLQKTVDSLKEQMSISNSELLDIQKQAAEKGDELSALSNKNSETGIQLTKERDDLVIKSEKLEAEKTLFNSQKDQLDLEKSKLKESIASLEKILKQLNSEKQKVAQEKKSLETNCETLKSRAETQEKLIQNLKQTYNDSLKNGTVKDIFEAQEINEVVQFLDSGQKLVSIPDARKRIHQFLIPKEHKDLKHEYYHKIAESLGEIIDPEDLPHEYKTEVQKYIRVSLPEYNCLT